MEEKRSIDKTNENKKELDSNDFMKSIAVIEKQLRKILEKV